MKKALIFMLILLIIWISWPAYESKPMSGKLSRYASQTVTIAAVGDTVMHMPIVNSVYDKITGSYDFRPIFEEVKTSIADTDFAVGVLETEIDPSKPLSGYPRFNSPGEIADALKWAGLDLVFVAHNHCLDQGISGVKSTLTYLDRIGLPYTGRRREKSQKEYYLADIKGIKLAFLSYTTTTNAIKVPAQDEWAINYVDLKKIALIITEAKKAGADGIILGLHTGTEYLREPSPEQQTLVKKLLDLGVDIVIGSHVHVIQPFEYVVVKTPMAQASRICFVAYSVGNLLSNQRWQYSDCGLLLKFKLEKTAGLSAIKIISVSHTPLWVNRFVKQGHVRYRIKIIKSLDSIMTDPDTDLNDAARERMKEVWYETEELQNNWNKKNNAILQISPTPDLFTTQGEGYSARMSE